MRPRITHDALNFLHYMFPLHLKTFFLPLQQIPGTRILRLTKEIHIPFKGIYLSFEGFDMAFIKMDANKNYRRETKDYSYIS